jgi:DNA-binding NtrC family response regulator
MANNSIKVLLINHEPAVFKFFEELNKKMNMQIDVCKNASEGIAAAKANDYLMCIIDVDLPGTDGLSVFETIHADRAFLPIYMMSYTASDSRVEKALERGVKGFILKPPDMDQIASSVQQAEVMQFFARQLNSILTEIENLPEGSEKRAKQKEYDKTKEAAQEAQASRKDPLKKTG